MIRNVHISQSLTELWIIIFFVCNIAGCVWHPVTECTSYSWSDINTRLYVDTVSHYIHGIAKCIYIGVCYWVLIWRMFLCRSHCMVCRLLKWTSVGLKALVIHGMITLIITSLRWFMQLRRYNMWLNIYLNFAVCC